MGYVAKLVRGAYSIDLSSAPYALGLDFKPGSTSFSIKITGGSSAKVRRAGDDINLFLVDCGDPAQPTYFEWSPDSNVSAAPVWGQSRRRVELLGGSTEYWDAYFEASVRDTTAFIRLSLDVGSVIEGTRQLAATATGGVCEDWIGTVDGQSRGVMVPEASMNKMTNPMFGHGTWNTGWTAGADITASKNTDSNFVLFGLNSAKLFATGTVTNTFTQSIAAGNTNTHVLSCYVILPNGSLPSAANCSLYYGTDLTTFYMPVGNGWYRLYASVTGIVAATVTGITVEDNMAIYIDCFQFEEKAYFTPFLYGDMLGCAWSGTVHASTSTRTAASLKISLANLLNEGEGTIRLIWKADKASSYIPDARHILSMTGDVLYIDYDGINNRWDFTGSVVAGTYIEQEIIVFHLRWQAITNQLTLYKNGASLLTNTYDTNAFGAELFFGSSAAATLQINGTFLGSDVFNHYMPAAEVLADYNNILPLITDDQVINPISYVWDKDGDGIADNIDSGSQQNWIVIGGVPGNLPADVEAKLTIAGMADPDVYLSRLDVPYNAWIDPEFLTNATLGTVALTTTNANLATFPLDNDEFNLLAGRKFAVMVRGDEGTANNINLRTGINPGGAYYYNAALASNWNTGTSTSIDMSPEIFMVENEEFYRLMGVSAGGTIAVQGARSSGTADFIIHAAQVLPYPLTRFINLSASGGTPSIAYIDGRAYEISSGSALNFTYRADGSKWTLQPNRYNLLITWLGREAILSEPGDTLKYDSIYVTPKWKMQ